ncbi:acyltransferase domain-containing protein, partial [Millisia brevis]|uniref:acyltransferase domain-containing protein n=1 Tax=Millisia brevis TaxID=264148 RepID=UPI0012EED263
MPDHRLPDGRTPVLLTADDPEGLRDEAIALDAYLTAYPEVPPAAIADMLWRTRSPRRRRALILAGDRSTLDAAVDAIARGHGHPDVVTATVGEPRRIAMVIAGQGSQRPGLGAGLHAASAGYRAEVDRCLEHLSADRAAVVRRYLLDDGAEGADGTTVQPALVVHALGMLALWRDHGVVPDLTVGHSLGEIAAAVAAGLLDRRDAIRIAEIRAAATASVTIDDHAMAALGISERDAAESIARRPGWAEITVVNGPESVCVNGDRATIADLIAHTTASGRFARPIAITHPAHTTAMRPLATRIRSDLAEAGVPDGFGAARIACIGGTLGARIPDDISVADYWYLNVRNTVRFDRAIVAAAAEIFVEIADHPILAAGIAGTLAGTAADGTRDTADPVVVTTSRRTARGLEEFSRALATVVLAQPRLDRAQWAVPGPVRLPLRGFPTTVMRRRRLWLPPADSAASSTPDVGRDEALRATPAAVAAPRLARPGV